MDAISQVQHSTFIFAGTGLTSLRLVYALLEQYTAAAKPTVLLHPFGAL